MADVSTTRTTAVVEPRWTAIAIAQRLAEAADVLDRLPEPPVRGYYSLLPIVPNAPAGDGARTRSAAPMPEAIDRMDEAIGWLCWLDPEERRLVWMRADGMSWKWITRRLGIGRTTAWQRRTMALLKIATRLNVGLNNSCPRDGNR
jgi:hypothetical protein